jgi:hypothetical protein
VRAGAFRVGVVFDKDIKNLFKKKAWNDSMKLAMTMAGREFIRTRLPIRFTRWSVSALGYNAKKLTKSVSDGDRIWMALAAMDRDGTRDMLVKEYCAAWGGWDPYGRQPAPAHIWRVWAHNAFKSGKIKASKSGDWATARRKMREECARETNLRGRLWNYARDVYLKDDGKDVNAPLVNTGWLFENHQRLARTEATATTKNWALKIPIPRENRVNKWVNRVLGNTTDAEAEDLGREVFERMQAFIDTATVSEVKKGKNKGRKSAKFSAATAMQAVAYAKNARNDKIANRLQASKTGAHKNRSTNGLAPRKVA